MDETPPRQGRKWKPCQQLRLNRRLAPDVLDSLCRSPIIVRIADAFVAQNHNTSTMSVLPRLARDLSWDSETTGARLLKLSLPHSLIIQLVDGKLVLALIFVVFQVIVGDGISDPG